jgi:hypothetical protein
MRTFCLINKQKSPVEIFFQPGFKKFSGFAIVLELQGNF